MVRINSGTTKPVFGITGGLGSGKSAVARLLSKRFGCTYIDADAVCRDLVEPGSAGWHVFRSLLGAGYFNMDQTLNRARLRQAIFEKEDIRKQVNQALHPLAKAEIARRVENDKRATWFLIEVPLLFEVGWDDELEAVIVVYARYDSCLERLMGRDRLSREEAERAIAVQWPLEEKALRADHVIDNSGSWAKTCLQVLHLGGLLTGSQRFSGRN